MANRREERAALEERIARHYARERAAQGACEEEKRACARLMAAEAAAASQPAIDVCEEGAELFSETAVGAANTPASHTGPEREGGRTSLRGGIVPKGKSSEKANAKRGDGRAAREGAAAQVNSGAGRTAGRAGRRAGLSLAGFVAAQARFVHPGTWAGQAALVLLAALACLVSDDAPRHLILAASLAGVATAFLGLPSLVASKAHATAELEYACRFNCANVMAARLIVLGCANAATLTCACAVVPALLGADALAVTVRACAPYFLACAGCLLVTRRARSGAAALLAALWTVLVAAATLTACSMFPQLYAATATGLWAAASAAALAWAAREACLLMRAAAAGLDAFFPAPVRAR